MPAYYRSQITITSFVPRRFLEVRIFSHLTEYSIQPTITGYLLYGGESLINYPN